MLWGAIRNQTRIELDPISTDLGSFSEVCEFYSMKVLVTQSCTTLWPHVDCIPQGSSVHRILQTSILEGIAISYSRKSSQPMDQTQDSRATGRFFTI